MVSCACTAANAAFTNWWRSAPNGAVSLIQRFGSAANLNIHLHCLVLDGVYRRSAEGAPEFVEACAPTDASLQSLLHKILTRMVKLLTRRGALVEEESSTSMADSDNDSDEAHALWPLQATACIYRIAFGPRAGAESAEPHYFFNSMIGQVRKIWSCLSLLLNSTANASPRSASSMVIPPRLTVELARQTISPVFTSASRES